MQTGLKMINAKIIFYRLFRIFNNIKIFKLICNTLFDLIQGDILKENISLKDIYKGKRCFIMGTGSSLNDIDFSLLADEYSFSCNYIFDHHDINKLKLKFYAVIDSIYSISTISYNHGSLPPEILYPKIDSMLSDPTTLFFINISARRFINKLKLFYNRHVYYIKQSLPMELAKTQSNELTERITFADGSIYFMMAAAIYMGFKELYLCGCGYTYSPIACLHFYDKIPTIPNDISKDERVKILDNVAASYNAIVYNYDKPLFIYDTPQDQKRHIIIKDFAISNGVRICNIVPDGFESPIYEKVSWEYVRNNVISNKEI